MSSAPATPPTSPVDPAQALLGWYRDAHEAALEQAAARAELEQGWVAICGEPHWQDSELAGLAAADGHAAALREAWQRHGRDCLTQMRGGFSFVIADQQADVLLAAIDRMGRHTLYYCEEPHQLRFGSTSSALQARRETPGAVAPQGLYDYFYFHMVPSPQSVYGGLAKLPAAHCLEYRGGKLQLSRYWQPTFSADRGASRQALGVELKQQLLAAVGRALPADRPCGSFLSGGLDSSTVTGALAELTDGQCPAYAIGFDEPGYDEMEFARISASHFGVQLQEYYVTPEDVVQELPTIATSYDEPFGNSSALPAYFCARRAREDGIEVLLAGDGGDELFAGNSRYAKQQLFELYYRVPGPLRRYLVEPLLPLLPEAIGPARKLKSYITQALVPLPDRLQSYNYLNRLSPQSIFEPDFLQRVDQQHPLELQRATYRAPQEASDLNRMLYLDWQYTLADNDLRKVSLMCQVAGVEARYPMLDDELVEFSCRVPDDWKLKRNDLRHFFKSALQGWLPQATIDKKKQGFGLPFGRWMQSYAPLNDMANDSLLRLKRRHYFRQDFIDRLLQLHRDEHAAYYGEMIWILTVFDLWLEGRGEAGADRPDPGK